MDPEKPPYEKDMDLIEDGRRKKDRSRDLVQIRELGPNKPMGYLPVESLKHYYEVDVAAEIERAHTNGYRTILFPATETLMGSEGALFVWHEEALQQLLARNRKFLEELGWSTNTESFVRHVAREWVPENTPLYNLIADAFGDRNNPSRTDYEKQT